MRRRYTIVPPVVGNEWKVLVHGDDYVVGSIRFDSLKSAKLYVKHMEAAETLPEEQEDTEE